MFRKIIYDKIKFNELIIMAQKDFNPIIYNNYNIQIIYTNPLNQSSKIDNILKIVSNQGLRKALMDYKKNKIILKVNSNTIFDQISKNKISKKNYVDKGIQTRRIKKIKKNITLSPILPQLTNLELMNKNSSSKLLNITNNHDLFLKKNKNLKKCSSQSNIFNLKIMRLKNRLSSQFVENQTFGGNQKILKNVRKINSQKNFSFEKQYKKNGTINLMNDNFRIHKNMSQKLIKCGIIRKLNLTKSKNNGIFFKNNSDNQNL